MHEENIMTNRQKQALKTKKKIYDTAIRLLKEYGLEKLTINKICKEAGVSVGSFYYYFKSLDFVVVESYKIVDQQFQKISDENKLCGTACEKVLQLVRYQTAYAVNMGIELVTQMYKSQISIGNDYFGSWDRPLPKLYIETIKGGQKTGELRSDYTAESMAREIIIMVRGYIYDWCIHNGNYNLSESAEASAEKLLAFYTN